MLADRMSPNSEIIPACSTGSLGIWGNHPNAGANQNVPIAYNFRIALPYQENDGRGVGRARVRKTALPVRRQQARALGDGIDIKCQGERDDVRLESVDHRSSLFTRT